MSALERKGVETTAGNRNRETKKKNANIKRIETDIVKPTIDEIKRIEANYNNINAVMKRMVQQRNQRQKDPPKPAQPTPKPSRVRLAVMKAVSLISEVLERLKAQFDKEEKQREIQRKQEAERYTAKAMQILENKKQTQEAGLKATREERKKSYSRRQSLENKKRALEAELEKQNKQQEAQRQQEAAQLKKKQEKAAAESYCKKISNQRLQGVNVPRHQVYTGEGDEMIFKGIQHEGNQPLLFCQKANNDVVLVVPIDQQTEHRLKQTQIGEKITLNSDHSIALKSENTRNRGRSR
ncbi:MAG: hypothetical protein J6V89_03030 [Acetobacter sp.]|nr:hypothetical protein [Acetobacter sp.]